MAAAAGKDYKAIKELYVQWLFATRHLSASQRRAANLPVSDADFARIHGLAADARTLRNWKKDPGVQSRLAEMEEASRRRQATEALAAGELDLPKPVSSADDTDVSDAELFRGVVRWALLAAQSPDPAERKQGLDFLKSAAISTSFIKQLSEAAEVTFASEDDEALVGRVVDAFPDLVLRACSARGWTVVPPAGTGVATEGSTTDG